MVGSAVIFLPLAVLILYRAKVHEKRMNSCLEIEIVPENVTSCGVLEAAKQILSRSLKEAGQIDLFVPRFPLPEPRQIPERALKYPRRTYVRLRFEQKVLAVSKTQAEAIPAAWKTCTIKGQ